MATSLSESSVGKRKEDLLINSLIERVKKGMAFVPQTNNVFTSLTVSIKISWLPW